MLLAENKSKNKMIYIQYEKYNKLAYRCVLMTLYCMATRFQCLYVTTSLVHNKSLRHVNLLSQFIQHMLVVHTRSSVKLWEDINTVQMVSFEGLNFMIQEDKMISWVIFL